MLYGLNSPARDAHHRAEKRPFRADYTGASRALLAVVLENLVAGRADLGPIFLEARQDGEIALIDDRTTVLLDVAGTGLLLVRCSATLLLLRECCLRRDRDRQQGESQERFTHRIPSFRQQETLFPICAFGFAGTDLLGWQCRVTQRRA